ncbi:MFS transporter [Planctomycetales bacterium ZRK34]|nr:MFS transporter [Planctomycetales bacterium ZRK34]
MEIGWLRVQYFLLYAVIGSYLPYMPVHMHELGFADWQIGWVLGVYGLAVMITPTFVTHLADRHFSHRALLRIGFATTGAALAATALCDSFAALIVWSLIFSIVYTPTFSLNDGMTFGTFEQIARRGQRPPTYHTVRIWGSFGFIAPSVTIFFVLHFTDLHSVVALWTGAAFAVLAAIGSFMLPHTGPEASTEVELPSAAAWRTLRRAPAVHLIVPLIILFIAINMYYAFYSVYLGELGIDRQWVGLILNIGVATEIVLMLFSGALLRRFGVRGVMVMAAGAMTLRMALLAAFPVPGIVIGSQLLHAPIVIGMYLLPPMYLNHKASASFRNSIQGLYVMICYGGTRFVGSILGGYVSDFSLRTTFTCAGALSLIATAWLFLAFRDQPVCEAIRRQHEKPINTPAPEV